MFQADLRPVGEDAYNAAELYHRDQRSRAGHARLEDRRGSEGELNADRTIDLNSLNSLDVDTFSAILGAVFEHSSWVACAVWAARPFASVPELHAAMVSIVANAGPDRQLALLRAHPELAQTGPLTSASSAEQGGIGLDRLSADEATTFDVLNADYRARFGFPFIIAVRGQRDRAAILAALSARLRNSPDQERAAALAEVTKITRFRLDDLIVPDASGS
jgi:2-oxo-4-hydroxy-4-carboxy-5-ureidoimidazoline decarboxylase